MQELQHIPATVHVTGAHGRIAATLAHETAAPDWVFSKRGEVWLIGPLNECRRVKDIAGYRDFAQVIECAWEVGDLWELRGVTLTKQEQAEAFVMDARPEVYGADEVYDSTTQQQIVAELKRLDQKLFEARHCNNTVAEKRALKEIGKLVPYSRDFRAVNGPKLLNTGEPAAKAYQAARKRKARAVKALALAGLTEIAEHFDKYYKIRPRTFDYCPDVVPNWYK